MFEARLYYIRRRQELPTTDFQRVYDVPYRPDYLGVTATINAYPDQVARVLKAVGPTTHGEDYFVPCLAADQRTRSGALIPQSERITFSNLRETVVALANPATNPQVREAFYAHNPIPGAIWRVENGSHVLVNPDEIMPDNYDIPQYRHDIREYIAMVAWLQHKVPKYVRIGEINYEGSGDASLFVSNLQEDLKMVDRQDGQPLEQYYRTIHLEGDIYEFWSSRRLKKIEQLEGQLNLIGELPVLAYFVNPYYVLRDRAARSCTFSTDYLGVEQILYG
jgi:hypothetical protein